MSTYSLFEKELANLSGVAVMPPDNRVTRRGIYECVLRIIPASSRDYGNVAVCDALAAEGIRANTA